MQNADNNLRSIEIPFDTVCFHCQQAAEKFLKSYLAGKCKSYPDDWYMPTKEDALEAREAANQVLRWLENALPQIF